MHAPDLAIAATALTPSIRTSWADGTLELRGDSYPENSFDLDDPVLAWVRSYLERATHPLRVELALVYLNTNSIRSLMDVLDLLEARHAAGGVVSVRWTYDARNERVGEVATEFKQDCTFPFEIVATG